MNPGLKLTVAILCLATAMVPLASRGETEGGQNSPAGDTTRATHTDSVKRSTVNFIFDRAPVDLAIAFFAELLDFDYDKNVRLTGEVSLQLDKEMTDKEVWALFDGILAANGITYENRQGVLTFTQANPLAAPFPAVSAAVDGSATAPDPSAPKPDKPVSEMTREERLRWASEIRRSHTQALRPPALASKAVTEGDYTYVVKDGKATITGFNKQYAGALTIPDTLGGCPVTVIASGAFQNCPTLTSVMIPESVTRIDERTFHDCSALESILVNVLNPVYSSSADGVLFNMEKTRLIRFPQAKGGQYTIPSRVTSTANNAFSGCTGLTGLTIPDTVTSIGNNAFFGCTRLINVTIPDTVTSIGQTGYPLRSRISRTAWTPVPVDDTMVGHRFGMNRLLQQPVEQQAPGL